MERNIIHINLAISLLTAQSAFIIGIDQTTDKVLWIHLILLQLVSLFHFIHVSLPFLKIMETLYWT